MKAALCNMRSLEINVRQASERYQWYYQSKCFSCLNNFITFNPSPDKLLFFLLFFSCNNGAREVESFVVEVENAEELSQKCL